MSQPHTPIPASDTPAVLTGVHLMKGVGVRPSRGLWTEAWAQVLRRPAARVALVWLAIVAFFAVFAPVLANGHPILLREIGGGGSITSPMWTYLGTVDTVLLVWAVVGIPYVLFGGRRGIGRRFGVVLGALMVAVAIVAISSVVQGRLEAMSGGAGRDAMRRWVRGPVAGSLVGGAVATFVALVAAFIPLGSVVKRLTICVLAAALAGAAVAITWSPQLVRYNYVDREAAGEVAATYTVIPWSPFQRFSSLSRRPPGTNFGEATGLDADAPPARRSFILGTDAFGADVLSQILHACRLSISIGVVSTAVALVIGVTIGSLMGYFGGWVDLLLFRVVEVFMAVPVLFLLIVAVAVLPDEWKTTYVIMAIIGCFTWTGMARFTRAEFMKLRNQDFVQSAQAAGLPLRSILFKHMLPNGVAPVLVDTSFAVAAAISIEAILSYLGLGPADSPSWGKLLASAISQEGEFKPWLAVYPGLAIFLTVLAYNILGETLRDAIDPKLKKARV